MKLGPLNLSWGTKAAADAMSIDQLITRLELIYATTSGISITPENCIESPTVKAIDTAITRRFAVMPPHVFVKSTGDNRTKKEYLPNHPVAKLRSAPNNWQTHVNFWMDASSWLTRYGNTYFYKARGSTGPIRRLLPLHPATTGPKQNDDDVTDVTYESRQKNGRIATYDPSQIMHARVTARDGLKGDSWIMDVRESIALEIAAERFGATFFGNGAMPGITFEYVEGSQGHKTDEERAKFLNDFNEKFTAKSGRFKAILPPKGIKLGTPIPVENEKAQFIQLRALQRTIIAGAAGVPPHLVGDLSKGTFNNVEMQGIEFTTNVILPLARVFEAAMERDLLTPEDRAAGVIIRFNLDAVQRGDFKTRQEGRQIQRNAGVISANEWRMSEGMKPRPDTEGDAYYAQGPSGQTSTSQPSGTDPPADQDSEDDTAA